MPAHRAFPSRVTESLGVCLKTGPGHRVVVDGKEVVFPESSICIRRPGCVWSTAGTGPVGFLSLDIDRGLLPSGLTLPAMTFVRNAVLPNFRDDARAALTAGSDHVPEVVGSMVFALEAAGALTADELRESAPRRTAARGREALEARVSEAPSLVQLAAELGTNRFVLMREFKRSYGITPHAFLMRLRIERARDRLARGADIVAVAIELGFADQAHFTRLFKRVVGTTPARYARSACVRGFVPWRTFLQEPLAPDG
jgi:AraC-like DNA-binding protein